MVYTRQSNLEKVERACHGSTTSPTGQPQYAPNSWSVVNGKMSYSQAVYPLNDTRERLHEILLNSYCVQLFSPWN